jgi:Zn-dependent protease/predicted transcriptional regulator
MPMLAPHMNMPESMPWSWKVARVAGIDLYVHATFLILLAWIGIAHWLDAQSVTAVLGGVAFMLSLFACVVLHEFGHALTARQFGIATRDITLLPIGGLARLERMPQRPLEEFLVAIAGPAVNVVLAALLFAWLIASGDWEPVDDLSVARGSFAERLLVVNVGLVLFNLLPAFPMDGGRVLRALLASRLPHARATQIAATIGQGMAILFGFLGLLGNPMLLFIALFVWIGAAQEAGVVEMKTVLAGIPVRRAMITDFRVLTPVSTLQDAVDLVLTGSQQDFPVVDQGRVTGILARSKLVSALTQHDRSTPVDVVMHRSFPTADASEMVEDALERLNGSGHLLPVLERGALVGLLTMENVAEMIMIEKAAGMRRPVTTQGPVAAGPSSQPGDSRAG